MARTIAKVILLGWGLMGCGARTGVGDRDGGPRFDAGLGRPDAGGGSDTGPGRPDAGPSMDGGVLFDAGPPPSRDAGTDARPPSFPDASVDVPGPSTIAAGGSHSCAVTAGGGVSCWGDNERDQIGPAGGEESATAVAVPIDGVVSISAGSSHNCALIADGTVRCWGADETSQLGRGNESWHMGAGHYAVPAPVVRLEGARSIASGGSHSCALRRDDRVLCWGANFNLETGLPVGTVVTWPVAVAGVEDVASIAAGPAVSCAIHGDGTVTCWGDDSNGLFTRPYTPGDTAPVLLPEVDSAVQIAADSSWGCALHRNGTVTCCPVSDETGILDPEACAPVPELTGVMQIGMAATACALVLDGSVWCWGWNNDGLAGSEERYVARPVEVPHLVGAVEITVGVSHACARLDGGAVQCWGRNEHGQVGAGVSGGVYLEPVTVVGL